MIYDIRPEMTARNDFSAGSVIGGASNSVPQTRVLFYKVRVNMQWIRDNPPFFEVYYLRGHMKPRVGDKLYTKTWTKEYESANMVVAGFSRGAIRPAPAGE